jgi:hypothetical protein
MRLFACAVPLKRIDAIEFAVCICWKTQHSKNCSFYSPTAKTGFFLLVYPHDDYVCKVSLSVRLTLSLYTGTLPAEHLLLVSYTAEVTEVLDHDSRFPAR